MKISKIISAIILLLLALNFQAVSAQNDSISYQSFKGIVKNAETNEILPYASVQAEGTNIATVTNIDGEFTIKINKNSNSDNLLSSSLGYKNSSLPLTSFSGDKPQTILLSPVTEFIRELTVRPASADDIIFNVIKKIRENYMTQAIMMTGFYRETVKDRRNYVSISEAVVDIYKSPYNNQAQFDQVKIDKGRKSTNVAKMDTLFVKMQGGPAVTLLLDVVKNPYTLFLDDFDKIYDFELENVVSLKDRLHYVISFRQKEYIDQPYFFGKIYVEIERLAISEAEFALNLDNKEEAARIFVKKKPLGVTITPINTSYRVSYTIDENKWFFNYARGEVKFKLNWKKKLFNSTYSLMSEIAITDRHLDMAEKIERKVRFKENDFMDEKVYAFFDPDYWGDYNLIEPDQSIETAIKKLYRQNK